MDEREAGDRPGSIVPAGQGAVGALLIDFDNLMPPGDGQDVSPAQHRLLRCISEVLEQSPEIDFLQVRLYGGWRSGGLLSRRGSDVASILPQLDPFPSGRANGSILRGSLDLATSLIGQLGLEFDDTYRRRGSVPRLRLSGAAVPDGCSNHVADECPARILKQFTRGPGRICPVTTCAVTAAEAFVASEQKMVDTLLTCDLLELATDPSVRHIAVVSADTDFVPPLLLARRRSEAVVQLLVPMSGWSPGNTALLSEGEVTVTEMEELDGAH